jgi:hypothetical protein
MGGPSFALFAFIASTACWTIVESAAVRMPTKSRPTYTYGFLVGTAKVHIGLNGPEKLATSAMYMEATKKTSTDSTGMSIWRGARTLCSWMAENSEELSQMEGPCVELGSGLGLCGVTLAKFGKLQANDGRPLTVLCTDGNHNLLPMIQANAELNGVSELVQVAPLSWGQRDQLDQVQELLGTTRPSLVIGSDLAYYLSSMDALVETICALDAERTVLSVRPRIPDAEGQSTELKMLSEKCAQAGLHIEVLRTEGTPPMDAIFVLELTRRKR